MNKTLNGIFLVAAVKLGDQRYLYQTPTPTGGLKAKCKICDGPLEFFLYSLNPEWRY